jgi:hypothetical protein
MLLAGACGQPNASTEIPPLLPTTNTSVSQDVISLPKVQLILWNKQFSGTLAAGGTSHGHFDPPPVLADITTATLPAEGKVVIAIESIALQNLRVTVRPWNRDGTIIPLVDSWARELHFESQSIGGTTIITLEPVGNSDDQLLNVNATFQDGWGFYLWRLNPLP